MHASCAAVFFNRDAVSVKIEAVVWVSSAGSSNDTASKRIYMLDSCTWSQLYRATARNAPRLRLPGLEQACKISGRAMVAMAALGEGKG